MTARNKKICHDVRFVHFFFFPFLLLYYFIIIIIISSSSSFHLCLTFFDSALFVEVMI